MNLLNFLFPKYCVDCGKEGEYFCLKCTKSIKSLSQICPVCEKASAFGLTHPGCKSKYCLDGLICFFAYEGVIKEAIHKIKYRLVTDLAGDLMKIVFKEIEKERYSKFAIMERYVMQKRPVIVSIPLYWYKENTRGFNQAQLIARFISLYYKIPLNTKVLKRKKWTISQTELSEEQRQKNVKGIFTINTNCQSLITNCLLIDDVWTTGSTLKSAGNILKRAGVKEVWGLTIAR